MLKISSLLLKHTPDIFTSVGNRLIDYSNNPNNFANTNFYCDSLTIELANIKKSKSRPTTN